MGGQREGEGDPRVMRQIQCIGAEETQCFQKHSFNFAVCTFS